MKKNEKKKWEHILDALEAKSFITTFKKTDTLVGGADLWDAVNAT